MTRLSKGVWSADEVAALRTASRLLSYLPGSNKVMAPFEPTSDPVDRPTREIDVLRRLRGIPCQRNGEYRRRSLEVVPHARGGATLAALRRHSGASG